MISNFFVISEHCLLVLKETELLGSDWGTHGEESYPEAAWLQLEVFTFFLTTKSTMYMITF